MADWTYPFSMKSSQPDRPWDVMTSPVTAQIVCQQILTDMPLLTNSPYEVRAHYSHAMQGLLVELRTQIEKERTGWVREEALA